MWSESVGTIFDSALFVGEAAFSCDIVNSLIGGIVTDWMSETYLENVRSVVWVV